jgi:hypothetical protein
MVNQCRIARNRNHLTLFVLDENLNGLRSAMIEVEGHVYLHDFPSLSANIVQLMRYQHPQRGCQHSQRVINVLHRHSVENLVDKELAFFPYFRYTFLEKRIVT